MSSQHFLIDLFTTPLSSSPIIDVTEPSNGQSLTNGAFVVRVPGTAALVDPVTGNPSVPQNAGDLVTKKYQGLLTFFGGFTNIVFDDFFDATGIDPSGTGYKGLSGPRGSVALAPGAVLTTFPLILLSAPTAAVLTWEVFTYVDVDPVAGQYTRTYNELPSTSGNTTAQISFDNGSTYSAATDGAAVNIPLASQGLDFILKITNTSSNRLYVGSWALIF